MRIEVAIGDDDQADQRRKGALREYRGVREAAEAIGEGEHMTHLREAVNVVELLERDALVVRLRELRNDAVVMKATLEHWNRQHPDEKQFDTSFEDQVVAWCDGKGPRPEFPK